MQGRPQERKDVSDEGLTLHPARFQAWGGPYLEVGRRGPVPMRLSAPLTGGVWLETLP